MTTNQNPPLALAAAIGLLATPALLAGPNLVQDHSFESRNVATNGFSNNLGAHWKHDPADQPSLAFVENLTNFRFDDVTHLGVVSGHTVTQDIPALFEKNTVYTLRVAVGNRAGQTSTNDRSSYGFSGNTSAGPFILSKEVNVTELASQNSFSEAPPISFNTQTLPNILGSPTIRLTSNSPGIFRAHFDDIRFEVTSILVTNTSDDGPGSLRQAISDAAHGDTILFDPALFNGEEQDIINLNSELSLGSKKITIDANAIHEGVTLSGQALNPIFVLTQTGADLSIDSLHLIDGRSNSRGGGIELRPSGTTLLVENCSISRCYAAGAGGGLWANGDVTLINTTFLRNEAEISGGALVAPEGSNVTLRHCTVTGNFHNNASTAVGGGVSVPGGSIKIENSIIASNRRFRSAAIGYILSDISYGPSPTSSFETSGRNIFGVGDLPSIPYGQPNANGDYAGTPEQPVVVNFIQPASTDSSTLHRPVFLSPQSFLTNFAIITPDTPDYDQLGRNRRIGPRPDIGAVESIWDEDVVDAVSPSFGTYLDMTYPDDIHSVFPRDSFTSASNERVDKAIDDDPNTKYLNFNRLNTGINVTTFVPSEIIGITLTSGGDAPGRDPFTAVLYGITPSGDVEIIKMILVPIFPARQSKLSFFFDRASRAYTDYRLVFPTVRGVANGENNSMQISEIELLGAPADRSVRFISADSQISANPILPIAPLESSYTFVVDPNKSFTWEFNRNLESPNWIQFDPAVKNTVGFKGTAIIQDAITVKKRFFRLIEVNN